MNFENLNFRMATKKDIKNIMKIEEEAFEKDVCEKEEVFLERIDIFKDGFLVIEFEGEIIGYISSEIWSYKENINETDFKLGHSIKDLHNLKGQELYISSFGILKKYRGSGLGKYIFNSFLNYIHKKFENINSTILLVSTQWQNAIRIYKKIGFIEIILINDFFTYENSEKNIDGIVMRKILNN